MIRRELGYNHAVISCQTERHYSSRHNVLRAFLFNHPRPPLHNQSLVYQYFIIKYRVVQCSSNRTYSCGANCHHERHWLKRCKRRKSYKRILATNITMYLIVIHCASYRRPCQTFRRWCTWNWLALQDCKWVFTMKRCCTYLKWLVLDAEPREIESPISAQCREQTQQPLQHFDRHHFRQPPIIEFFLFLLSNITHLFIVSIGIIEPNGVITVCLSACAYCLRSSWSALSMAIGQTWSALGRDTTMATLICGS